MLNITLATLKADITPKLKGTSLRQISDFYATVAGAANRMLSRIDPQETIRIVTMSTPFFDQINDYALVTDFKRMIDIRPQVNRQSQPGLSHYSETTPRQFLENLDPNSFSIKWNNGQRSIRAQKLPTGNVVQVDSFDTATSNGSWAASGDISGLYAEALNFVEGNGSLGMNLSGATGTGYIENSTAAVLDLSAYLWEDSSFFYLWIPSGKSALFTSLTLRRGSSSLNYKTVSITTKADGTAFNDGWNLCWFDWNTAVNTGSPDNTKSTYKRITMNTTAGTAIAGVLLDNFTNSMGDLAEIEYYSEMMFRTAAGVWIDRPTDDSDIVCVGPSGYEILKAEMMVDIVQEIRTGNVRKEELAEWMLKLNGQPQSRYVKDPPFHGAYADYLRMFPSSAIVTRTKTYDFDI